MFPPDDSSPLVGTTLGPYRLETLLGEGGMGKVFQARDLRTDRSVALKVVHRSANPRSLQRFAREAELLGRISHPNVVQVHDFHAGPPAYLVTELVEGEDLAQVLRTQGALPPARAASLVGRLADGVEALHAAGVLHRDLKPDNVVVRANGEPVLLDFGVARDESAERLTQTGALVGTPNYMSPEQATGDRALQGPATDVYGLGALLYQTLSGQAPFAECDTLQALVSAILDRPPQPLSKLAPNTPPDLVAIATRCMAKRAADRYPTAAALRDDLTRVLAGQEVRGVGVRRSRSLFLVAAAIGLAAAIALLARSRRARPTPNPAVVEARPNWRETLRRLEALPLAKLEIAAKELGQSARGELAAGLVRLLEASRALERLEKGLADPEATGREPLAAWRRSYESEFPLLVRSAAHLDWLLDLRLRLRRPRWVPLDKLGLRARPLPMLGKSLLVPAIQGGRSRLLTLDEAGTLTPLSAATLPALPALSRCLIRAGTLLGIDAKGELHALEIATGKTWRPLGPKAPPLRRLAVCGSRLVLSGERARAWTLPLADALQPNRQGRLTQLERARRDVGTTDRVNTPQLLSVSEDMLLQLIDSPLIQTVTLRDLRLKGAASVRFFRYVTCAAAHPSGLVALADDGLVTLIDREQLRRQAFDGKQLQFKGAPLTDAKTPLKDHPGQGATHLKAVRSMVFAQDGELLVTLSRRGTTSELRVWRCADQVLLATARVRPSRISLGLAPWGGLVGTTSDSRTPAIALWDLPTRPR